jgi:predicted metal-dependent HD superfamily phosphohydrolase
MTAAIDTLVPSLRRRWIGLLPTLRGEPADVLARLNELVAAYTGPERHYHDLRHIAALLSLADAEAARFADKASVELAIFFHDVVYDARATTNEQESADLARRTLRQLGMSATRYERVARLVEWTAHATNSAAPDDPDTVRFLDLDLAILAAPAAEYDAYAAAIRREYAHVPDAAWRKGRAKVLRAFAERPHIYLCNDHTAWERAARDNLCRELTMLEATA